MTRIFFVYIPKTKSLLQFVFLLFLFYFRQHQFINTVPVKLVLELVTDRVLVGRRTLLTPSSPALDLV